MFNRYIHLYDEFDPTGTDGGTPLPIGDYRYTEFGVGYRSDQRNVFSYGLKCFYWTVFLTAIKHPFVRT